MSPESHLCFYSINRLGQALESAQAPPLLLEKIAEFEHHMHHAIMELLSLRTLRPLTDRRNSGLNRIGGPNILPVLGRVIVVDQ